MLSAAAAHGGGNVEYCRGVIDTVRAQTTTFGIPWPSVATQIRQALIDAGRSELIALVGTRVLEG